VAAAPALRGLALGLAAAALLAGAGWLAGFASFEHMARLPGAVPDAADGIVVLTGGADRIEAALGLMAEGRAPLLLVSGVGRGLDVGELLRRVQLSPEQAAHVTLGRAATSTYGNAAETAAWARAHGMRSLIVVTAGYHMPRALTELGRALPGVALHPVPVQSPVLRRGMELGTVRMLANEYDKYLAVQLGLGPGAR
jgi:uncharacterized SAM-binding protein YcdF (DUF218 family)